MFNKVITSNRIKLLIIEHIHIASICLDKILYCIRVNVWSVSAPSVPAIDVKVYIYIAPWVQSTTHIKDTCQGFCSLGLYVLI